MVIPVSWPESRVWNANSNWYQSFFIIFFTQRFFLFYHSILNFLKIELRDFFFIFIRLSSSHKLGWVPSGFAQFSSICFWSFFKIKYFYSSTFLHFFLELGFIILVICFQLDSFVHMIWLARFRGLTWVRWCFIFSGFFCWLIFLLLLLFYIWTDGN